MAYIVVTTSSFFLNPELKPFLYNAGSTSKSSGILFLADEDDGGVAAALVDQAAAAKGGQAANTTNTGTKVGSLADLCLHQVAKTCYST